MVLLGVRWLKQRQILVYLPLRDTRAV